LVRIPENKHVVRGVLRRRFRPTRRDSLSIPARAAKFKQNPRKRAVFFTFLASSAFLSQTRQKIDVAPEKRDVG